MLAVSHRDGALLKSRLLIDDPVAPTAAAVTGVPDVRAWDDPLARVPEPHGARNYVGRAAGGPAAEARDYHVCEAEIKPIHSEPLEHVTTGAWPWRIGQTALNSGDARETKFSGVHVLGHQVTDRKHTRPDPIALDAGKLVLRGRACPPSGRHVAVSDLFTVPANPADIALETPAETQRGVSERNHEILEFRGEPRTIGKWGMQPGAIVKQGLRPSLPPLPV